MRILAAVLLFGTASWLSAQTAIKTTDASGARATQVTGQVSWIRDGNAWALSFGDSVPVQQTIKTGPDGNARFALNGGTTFDLFSDTQVLFRKNAETAGDLLDVVSGHVRVHFQPNLEEPQQRVFTGLALITANGPATIALAIDEGKRVRIDVLEGEIRVQHALLPRSEPVIVKAVDAIMVDRDEPLSRRVDRGSLYRYTVRIWTALTFGHHDAEPIEQNKFLRKVNTPQFLVAISEIEAEFTAHNATLTAAAVTDRLWSWLKA